MNRIQRLFNEQAGNPINRTYDFALRRLCVAKEDSWRGIVPSNYSSDYNPEPPIFSAKFANCDGYRHLLAIANEDGKIALQDTTQRNYESEERSLSAPQCHFNAVFDLAWAPGQMKFVSASGDHTARLWEVVGSDIRSLRIYNGHTRSVKTAAFRKSDASVFATGGRDGAIIIWDTRAHLNVDLTPRADNCIYSGHVGGPGTPVSQKKRVRTPKFATTSTSSSITGLVFQDENTLISCGAGDGIIKVWDLRRNYTAYKKEPTPKNSLPYAGTSTFKGFTNLLIDGSGTKLFANCMDNTIYCYNISSYAPKPLARYKGLLNSTFYIKSCLSPDEKYLLSGSSDEKAYIWNLDYPNEPLVSLDGHSVEVTCVAWGSTHDRPIVTCSDDARHKIWRIGPEDSNETQKTELYKGHAEYVRTFGQQALSRRCSSATHKYNLRDLESTPRSLKRLVEHNERTPSSAEKTSTKRSFLEMLGAMQATDCGIDEAYDIKRPRTLESRGRRLFSPSCSSGTSCISSTNCHSTRCLNIHLSAIAEDCTSPPGHSSGSPLGRHQILSYNHNQENRALHGSDMIQNASITATKCLTANINCSNATPLSPLSERAVENLIYITPPIDNAASTPTSASIQHSPIDHTSPIFSPTTNLPNFVVDGDAPHLGIMSPKRKLKVEKVDWLTKIRKQKLMSSCRSTSLSDKLTIDEQTEQFNMSDFSGGINISSRLSSVRVSESERISPCRVAPMMRRRISHSGTHHPYRSMSSPTSSQQMQHHHHHHFLQQPKTPTSSRRKSETSILRFFTIQQQRMEANAAAAAAMSDVSNVATCME